jgi:uncharacterized protein (TIGR00369 family)
MPPTQTQIHEAANASKAMSQMEAYKQRYLALTPQNNYDRQLWQNLEVTSAHSSATDQTSRVTFTIVFPTSYANHLGTANGGMIATLFDGMTSGTLGLLSRPGFWDGLEVSRDLQVRFFRPCPMGEPVDAACEVVHVGARLATISGTLR